MAITINGSANTIAGLAVGGLPNGTVTDAEITAVSSSKLSGALPAISGAALTGVGINGIDVWRLTSSNSGDQTPISSNWARNNEAGTSLLGSGMTESSGVFTFPSTGHWLIQFNHAFGVSGNERYANSDIQITTDNGSNWDEVSRQGGSITQVDGSTTIGSAQPTVIFDVTSTTTHKVRFCAAFSNNSCTSNGATDISQTTALFIRLGDT
jgi:hypothetical protein